MNKPKTINQQTRALAKKYKATLCNQSTGNGVLISYELPHGKYWKFNLTRYITAVSWEDMFERVKKGVVNEKQLDISDCIRFVRTCQEDCRDAGLDYTFDLLTIVHKTLTELYNKVG